MVIGAQSLRYAVGRYDLVKRATKRDTINYARLNTESDDTSSKLTHHYQYPMALDKVGFTPKKVNTPKTVLC